MRLAISNIAWAPEERLAAYDLMQSAGLYGLEIAPGLFFSKAEDPFLPDEPTARTALQEMQARNLSLVSMQSLLFGVQGAALFGDEAGRARFEWGMVRAIDLAGRFGIPNLVFGSPLQRRIPEHLAADDAMAQAVDVFRRLGDRAAAAGTILSMEPNPAAYGTNFLTTLDQAQAFVDEVAHPAVALILDLGAMHMNGSFDTVEQRLEAFASRLNHVHVSEPQLAPAPSRPASLVPILQALQRVGYAGAVSIEMKRPEGGLKTVGQCIVKLAQAASIA